MIIMDVATATGSTNGVSAAIVGAVVSGGIIIIASIIGYLFKIGIGKRIDNAEQSVINHRQEITEEVKEVKTELRADIKEVKTELREEIKDLRSDIKSIGGRIDGLIQSRLPQTDQANFKSPLDLTESGKKTAQKSGLNRYVDENIDRFSKSFSDLSSKSDIHEKAVEVTGDLIYGGAKLDPGLTRVKDFYYDEGISRHDFRMLFAIVLRNKVLDRDSVRQN